MEPAAATLSSQSEREKQIRFERLSETFSYIAIIAGIILSFLPYRFSFEQRSLHISLLIVTILTVFWFRVLPKKYSGARKNFLYAIVAIIFISIAVHFTRGIQSVAIFLLYVTSIGCAASMDRSRTAFVVFVACLALAFEAFVGFNTPELGRKSISIAFLHMWGLILTTSYGWLVFKEENMAKDREKKAKISQVEAIDRVKNEFVYIISNKLKEPIGNLKTELAKALEEKKDLAKEQTEILEKTKENSDRLASLIEDLSDISKIETGSLRLELKPTDIGQIVAGTMSDFTFPAHQKEIKLVYNPPTEPVLVMGDSGRLHEIIANLVDNAIKYSTPKKEVRVSLEKENEMVKVIVEDQGYGIPQNSREHIFEKFYRVDRPDRTEPKGTGLGLFITKQLVERQGGKIWFETEENEGTKFIFTIPSPKK